jgi:hypothetical protein
MSGFLGRSAQHFYRSERVARSDAVRRGSYRAAHPTGEVTPVPTRRDAYELLLIEEADAWFEYLEATRVQTAHRYKELEPWAWARLTQRQRAIGTKKTKLKPAAAA